MKHCTRIVPEKGKQTTQTQKLCKVLSITKTLQTGIHSAKQIGHLNQYMEGKNLLLEISAIHAYSLMHIYDRFFLSSLCPYSLLVNVKTNFKKKLKHYTQQGRRHVQD